MAPEVIASLLKLPAGERADLAMALWESLDDSAREAVVDLTPAQVLEFERRRAEHDADPSTAIPWSEVRRRLSVDR